jgi:polyhydroxyalkanoate synthesis regulator phasin
LFLQEKEESDLENKKLERQLSESNSFLERVTKDGDGFKGQIESLTRKIARLQSEIKHQIFDLEVSYPRR